MDVYTTNGNGAAGASWAWILLVIIVVIIIILLIGGFAWWNRRLVNGSPCGADSQCASGACAHAAALLGSPKICCANGKTTTNNVTYCT